MKERNGQSYLPAGLILFILLGGLWGCHKFTPPQHAASQPFEARLQTEKQGDISVSIAIPTWEETQDIFGTDLYVKKMQPVWVQVENRSKHQLAILQTSIDPEYYSPNEAAYKTKEGYSSGAQWDREVFFQKKSLPLSLPPHSKASGYVITHRDEGAKYVTLDILTETNLKRFQFLVELPIQPGEYSKIDLNQLYQSDQITELNLEELRAKIESLPCCATGKQKGKYGDPVNLVIIGNDEETLSAFVRSGWIQTMDSNSPATSPYESTLSKRPFQYNLRTPLWYLDRVQDLGFHKPRQSDDGRTQFWLWLTPWRYENQRVWIGTLTRDIGLRYAVKSPNLHITHKIDSDVDETRDYLLEDLISIGAVDSLAWVRGVGYASPSEPKKDFSGDHWYTDGLRLVLFISDQPKDLQEINILDWEIPPKRGPVSRNIKQ